jgi:hypothetical protein
MCIISQFVTGDLFDVTVGKLKTIWWEPQLEGLTIEGWEVILTTLDNVYKKLGIIWALVQGGPKGDYYISTTEVTFNQFDTFCEKTGYKKTIDNFGRGQQPVINIFARDANAFCQWLSKDANARIRLPKEEEWVYAAKGGQKSKSYQYSGSN